jgi:hypothetical protein
MADAAFSPDISLREIDYDRLEDVEENPEAVLFRVKLSSVPTDIWMQEFEVAYRVTPYGIKPPLQIVEDTLEIVFLPRYASELPAYFHFLNLMVRRANEETHVTEQIHAAGSRDRHKSDMREALRRIQLSA